MSARERAEKVLAEVALAHNEHYETEIGDYLGCGCGEDPPGYLPLHVDPLVRKWHAEHLAAEQMKALEQEMGLRVESLPAGYLDQSKSASRLVTGWQREDA